MGFWFFLLIMNLLIPGIMVIFGWYYRTREPGRINRFVGYRTERSMKNEESWLFAHRKMGEIWWKTGWVVLILSLTIMLLLIKEQQGRLSAISMGLCFAQLLVLFVSIFFVERALKQRFDNAGHSHKR